MTQPGDFSFLKDTDSIEMLSFTYQAVNNTNSWEFMKTFDPESDGGFASSTDPQLAKIGWECEKLEWGGHTGSSWVSSMRQIQYIAKFGWTNFLCSTQWERQRL